MAAHGRVVAFADGVLEVEAEDTLWLGQMLSMGRNLEREVAAIAEVKLTGIHFYLRRSTGSQRK